MKKRDFIYSDSDGYKVRMLSLAPDNPRRILLIPPLVGASGMLAIKTFRYFLREDCVLMSFDYCGHCDEVKNIFTLSGTFRDTQVALKCTLEQANKQLPVHVVGTCYGLIPLIYSIQAMGWPKDIKSILSVNGLLNINDILNFDEYKVFLRTKGPVFKNETEFIKFITTEKDRFVQDKQKYIEAMSEYLADVFKEIADIVTTNSFGILEYSKVDFYQTFHQFMTNAIPNIQIPDWLPCLFFAGTGDAIFSLQDKESKTKYFSKTIKMAPHAKIFNIRIDHFGRGIDHYLIGEEGGKFLLENES